MKKKPSQHSNVFAPVLGHLVDQRSDAPPASTQIESIIRSEILAGNITSGDPLPLPTELAASSGLSASLFSRAYEKLQQAGLVVRVKKKGTFVSQTPARPARTSPIRAGIVIGKSSSSRMERDPIVLRTVVDGCLEAIAERGWESELCHLPQNDSIPTLSEVMQGFQRPVDGLISYQSLREEDASPYNLPGVYIHNEHPGKYPRIRGDAYQSIADLTRRAVAAGHSKIICFGYTGGDYYMAERRFIHHQEVMDSLGLTADEEAFEDSCETPAPSPEHLQHFLEKHRGATAVLCLQQGLDATRLVTAAEALGWDVPRDLSILSYGRASVVRNGERLPVTSVDHDYRLIAELAIDVLGNILKGKPPAYSCISVPPQFEKGVTLAPPADKESSKSTHRTQASTHKA